jgi:hypothetical protein
MHAIAGAIIVLAGCVLYASPNGQSAEPPAKFLITVGLAVVAIDLIARVCNAIRKSTPNIRD